MASRSELLALVDQAARDPSGARRLLEQASFWVDQELRTAGMPPSGYVYAGAHTLLAEWDELDVEPLPDPDHPEVRPLTATVNEPRELRIPFDCLIEGVSGWAAPKLITGLDADGLNGQLRMSACQDGRDLFTVMWNTDGKVDYSTDGRHKLLEPAPCIVGTRRCPRPLGWQLKRGTLLNVYVRNITNLLNPSGFVSQREAGWTIAVSVEFHLVNMETP